MSENHWRRPGLGEAILEALRTTGKNAPTIDDLAPFDHFHGGGIAATRRLARAADPSPGSRVLDLGGGLGGPARLLAVEHGSDVTVLDLTEDYVRAGETLTALLRLEDRVRFHQGNALDLPFPDESFDLVWTQNSGMNIADKGRLYRGVQRVLRPGGRLATQEPVAGPVQPPHFPLMWARDAGGSFLLDADGLRALILSSGFTERVWEEITSPPAQTAAVEPNIQTLVMGGRLPAIQASSTRNWEERRLGTVMGVFART